LGFIKILGQKPFIAKEFIKMLGQKPLIAKGLFQNIKAKTSFSRKILLKLPRLAN
jgi:hypothetical protein